MDEALQSQARHLCAVEKLSIRQVAQKLGISRKKAARLISRDNLTRKKPDSIIKPYEGLIQEWYREYPFLQAIQVYERLKSYGFTGGYTSVKEYTQPFRKKRSKKAYHELVFLPGQEAQVDWMQRTLPFGVVYGFVYILAFSRYLYVRFYPRSSMEFFLDGHIEAFRETGGVAGTNRYDNLKSVVISRKPDITYNAQFLDFARHYGFSIYACNPGKANEKGRVERVIRDIGGFISINTFRDIEELNKKVSLWRIERNNRVHRTTEERPLVLLKKERLKGLPQIPYKPYRVQQAAISTTGFVYFDTNRYSVPSSYSGTPCDIFVYPGHIEITVKGRKIAVHPRTFKKKTKIENPAHRERLLEITPNFKHQRIYQLMRAMDKNIEQFIVCNQQEGQDPLAVAYGLFKLLKGNAKETLISAVKEALTGKIYKAAYVQSLLEPSGYQDNPVHPQDTGLLSIDYEGRDLSDYDELI
jgi:transposase